jgi:hypothetical protein
MVFIYGFPATGKLAVARVLAALTGYKLLHNLAGEFNARQGFGAFDHASSAG